MPVSSKAAATGGRKLSYLLATEQCVDPVSRRCSNDPNDGAPRVRSGNSGEVGTRGKVYFSHEERIQNDIDNGTPPNDIKTFTFIMHHTGRCSAIAIHLGTDKLGAPPSENERTRSDIQEKHRISEPRNAGPGSRQPEKNHVVPPLSLSSPGVRQMAKGARTAHRLTGGSCTSQFNMAAVRWCVRHRWSIILVFLSKLHGNRILQ